MEKVFIHMRKSTVTMAGCLLIICLIPFITHVSAAKQEIITTTVELPAKFSAADSFAAYNFIDLNDHRLYFEFEVFTEIPIHEYRYNVSANIIFSVLPNDAFVKHSLTYARLPDYYFIYKVYDVSTLDGSVVIPDTQDYWLIFTNNNTFGVNITYSMAKEEIGTNAYLFGSVIVGVGFLGFIAVILFRKKPQTAEIPVETNQ